MMFVNVSDDSTMSSSVVTQKSGSPCLSSYAANEAFSASGFVVYGISITFSDSGTSVSSFHRTTSTCMSCI